MCVRLFCYFALCVSVSVPFASGATPDISRARELMRDLPVRFEPNLGQWNARVKFFARAGDSQLLLTSREAVLSAGGRTVGLSLLHADIHALGLHPFDPGGHRCAPSLGFSVPLP